MANSVMMFDALGYPAEHPDRAVARRSIDRLLVERVDEVYCQPCVSPVWDTALACHALMEVGTDAAIDATEAGLEWVRPLQVLDVAGDWAAQRPEVRPGGWAFQYNNAYYPDLDDTAVVVMAMDRAQRTRGHQTFQDAIERGDEWVRGLQSRNGGWGAFDADNNALYLNNIPFSDHGALLDPPTEDVTGRCVSMLAQLGGHEAGLQAGLEFLRRTQRSDGSWFGRWGLNYIYGAWSSLCALRAAGLPPEAPEISRAANWLVAIENASGGWGEDGSSYGLDYVNYQPAPSTASQTSWALLGLMAAGRADHPSVARGIAFLLQTQQADGVWLEERYTGTGFPRVFYLRYHGYAKFFPLWALARYRKLVAGGKINYGM
jgi:squalene-hopene/tetraprenyl-beta-curcumene cyclase